MPTPRKGMVGLLLAVVIGVSTAIYLRIHPDIVHFRLAEWLDHLDRGAVATDHLERSIAAGLDHPDRLREATLTLLGRDEAEPAFVGAWRLNQSDALDPGTRSAFAGHFDRLGQPERALALYESNDGLGPAGIMHHASLLDRAGQPEAAMTRYRELLRELPAERVDTGQSTKPEDLADPETTQARLELARLLAERGRHDEAITEYRRVLDDQPEHQTARLGLARTLFWAGDTERAAAEIDGLETTDLEPQDRLMLADLQLSRGGYERAIDLYRDYLEGHPDDQETRYKKALALAWSARYDAAIEAFDQVLQARPHDRQLMRQFAQVLTWADQPDRAIELLQKSLED
ncbi:tetratricopeptide repeat protein [Halorhodospira halophila]|uniref:Tetratricopeptide TPR_2 repeat protein n=1 Tax=Halorhodospira halophila (strain DSM 244 / SL1) TaxID=349124 RepID=A1WTI8_HALHL|nr:tetratricopeptide repeat protein [Halorhodospira halophila]ABM61000.1 Tetratricopeptide TPR_2 repeat protein [Halorhodospira halophila SL1]MBK1729991.1 hypothetical protein [Halorhodospira halophila]